MYAADCGRTSDPRRPAGGNSGQGDKVPGNVRRHLRGRKDGARHRPGPSGDLLRPFGDHRPVRRDGRADCGRSSRRAALYHGSPAVGFRKRPLQFFAADRVRRYVRQAGGLRGAAAPAGTEERQGVHLHLLYGRGGQCTRPGPGAQLVGILRRGVRQLGAGRALQPELRVYGHFRRHPGQGALFRAADRRGAPGLLGGGGENLQKTGGPSAGQRHRPEGHGGRALYQGGWPPSWAASWTTAQRRISRTWARPPRPMERWGCTMWRA